MFYIDQTTKSFLEARDIHYQNLRFIIKKKLLGNKFNEAHPTGLTQTINKINGIHSSIYSFFNDEVNLRNILIGTPDVLDKIKEKFITKKEKESIKSLIRYDAFINKNIDNTFGFYNAYDLAKNLDIQTCIYCNRLYTHTIITEKRELISRPTFDHWFPQKSYPILALSFYNLIPSCNVCNTNIKGASEFSLKNIFHPYLKHLKIDENLQFSFSYDMEDHLKAKCKINSRNKFTEDSLIAMKTNEIYLNHTEEIRELLYLKKAYSESYLESLKTILKVPLSKDEIYRLAFGVYLDDVNLNKRPLSKLRKDILLELGILK